MAEDEEGEGFGDFKFAQYPNQTNIFQSNQISGRKASFAEDNDDEDWGDFINHSSQINGGFNLSNGFSSSKSQPGPSESSKRSEPFGFENSGVGPPKNQRVKPQGSLPLSLFGEEEEEVVESGADSSNFGPAVNYFATKIGASVKKGTDVGNVGVGVSDLIKSLYRQNEQIKVENGLNLNSDVNGSNLDFRSLNSNVEGLKMNSNGLNLEGASSNTRNFDLGSLSSTSGLNVDSNGLKSDLVEESKGFDVGDADWWEFKAANPESTKGNWSSKEQSVVERLGLNAKDTMQIEQEIQIARKALEDFGRVRHSFGFSTSAPNPGDLFIVSNGISSKTGEPDLEFPQNLSFAAQYGVVLDSYSKSKHNVTQSGLSLSSVDENAEFDEWEFKDASSGTGLNDKLEDPEALYAPPPGVEALTFNSGRSHNSNDLFAASNEISNNSNDLFAASNEFSNKWNDLSAASNEISNNLNDLFAASNKISNNSAESDFGFHFSPRSMTNDGTNPKIYPESSLNDTGKNSPCPITYTESSASDTGKGLNTSLTDRNIDAGDNFWEFKDAFSETVSNNKTEPVVANDSSIVKAPASNSDIQEKLLLSANQRGALPLALFGGEQLETSDNPSINENISSYTPVSFQGNSSRTPGSNIPINDLISSLYSQAEQNSSTNHTPEASENGMHSNSTIVQSDLLNGDDDSWEFHDASSLTKVEDQTSINDLGVLPEQPSTKLELSDLADFYRKLKDELSCDSSFDNLKKAQSSAALSGEDAKAKALGREMEKFSDGHPQDMVAPEKLQLENSLPKICLNELIQLLREPKFKLLESEYQLSTRLYSAEKDLRSANQLLHHAVSMLKILELRSVEEQSNYVSLWHKMVSICAQELKHGALIWEQSLQKNIDSQILSEPKGKQYILALGEVYRVAEILSASAKLYKPWILLSSVDPTGLLSILSECSGLWSSSGLNEAFCSISDPDDFRTFSDSINYIHDLDEYALQNRVLCGTQPTCGFSVLSAETVPGMEMVVWNGEHYFLKLANLWANLISCEPPQLLHTKIS